MIVRIGVPNAGWILSCKVIWNASVCMQGHTGADRYSATVLEY